MAIGDIYELKVYQDYGTRVRECLNVYYFRQTGVAGDSQSVRRAFLDVLDPLIRAWQSSILRTSFLEARNLFNVTDFDAIDVTGDDLLGLTVQSALPVHDTITFRLIRTTRDIRNGYKRYTGITETSVDNGQVTNTETITQLETLRVALAQAIVDPDDEDATYQLVILKRIRHEPDEEHATVWYTLPQTIEDAVYSDPAAVLVNLFITTQNSRKPN